MAQPTLYIVAGPNGSGKTTFALTDSALKSIPFINADIEAQRLSPGSPAKAALAAGRTTLSNIAREISEGRTFALETTLSGLSALETMRQAIAAGYSIDLTYLCLTSPYLNVRRIVLRVSAGGHHVPDKDVLRRYSRSLLNLPFALALAERARVFDNTKGRKPRLVFEWQEHRSRFVHEELPDWFKAAFRMDRAVADPVQHIDERLREIGANQK